MTAGDTAGFGLCSETGNMPHQIEKRYVGSDDHYDEVNVLHCIRCRRCWLHYLMEYEYDRLWQVVRR